MSDGTAFIPGRYPKQGVPLQRYLPPLMEGSASRWLEERVRPGSWVLDPFGASPRLAVEIARSGYRLLAAVNNPIARFLIELYANPPSEAELVAALADLGSAQKAGERIEPQIRMLFKTECANCGGAVEAQAFIWESELNTLVGKIVSCPFCKENGEQDVNEADLARSARSSGGSLYRARALERVAPLSDPDRAYAEEALAVYPPRTLHALFDVINRLDTIPQHHRRAASALLLAAFDQANGLWHQPPVKSRPRQLNLPQRYLEKNVWKAMELAVKSWSDAFGELNSVGTAPQVSCWPELPLETNGICLFEGRLKDLAAEMQTSSLHAIEIAAVIGAFPRPNQAFWTLSALWAGWLWGSSASGPFKSVLRRRRYDWGWHTVALTAALTGAAELTLQGTPMMGLIGEIEPGFISASLLAAEFSGFELEGTALRIEPELVQLSWRRGTERLVSTSEETDRRRIIRSALLDFLRKNGEPAAYLKLHTAALCGLIRSHAISPPDDGSPADLIHQFEDSLAEVLTRGSLFVRFGAGGRSLDAGRWWLGESSVSDQNVSLPLADRVEMLVVRSLMSNPVINLQGIELAVFSELKDLFTPDFSLIQACLDFMVNRWKAKAKSGAFAKKINRLLGGPTWQRCRHCFPYWAGSWDFRSTFLTSREKSVCVLHSFGEMSQGV